MKSCITCGETKPLTEFWKQKSCRDGHFGECKLCARRRNKVWHERNREDIRPRQRSSRLNYLASRTYEQSVLASAKWRSKRLGVPFELTISDIQVPSHCPVLGFPLRSYMGTGGRTGGRDDSPSLDRIDNDLGYVPGNVVVVSHRANRLKCNATVDELEAVARFYRELLDGQQRRKG